MTDLPTPKPEGPQFCSVCNLFWHDHPPNPTAEDCIALAAKNGHDPERVRALIIAEQQVRLKNA